MITHGQTKITYLSYVCRMYTTIWYIRVGYVRDMDCNDQLVHDLRLIEMEEVVSLGLVTRLIKMVNNECILSLSFIFTGYDLVKH